VEQEAADRSDGENRDEAAAVTPDPGSNQGSAPAQV
jgi:hypothetical protein